MRKRDAYGLGIALAFMLALPAHAQSFQDEVTCYSWEGGHKSAGSFSKCNRWEVVKATPVQSSPPGVPAPQTLRAAPVCPPQITVVPEQRKAKPLVKRKPKPVTC